MQIQKGKAWEIWLLVVTLDRQKVDTRGAAVPDKESRGKSFHKAASIILFTIHDARDSAIQNRDYYGLPPVCLTSPHMTKYLSDQRLEVGVAPGNKTKKGPHSVIHLLQYLLELGPPDHLLNHSSACGQEGVGHNSPVHTGRDCTTVWYTGRDCTAVWYTGGIAQLCGTVLV